jgi:hypothetical protein
MSVRSWMPPVAPPFARVSAEHSLSHSWLQYAALARPMANQKAGRPGLLPLDVHGYWQVADWIVLRLKVISRAARSAPLPAATPVGCPPPPVAQIRLS